jgi:hypothetical protein
MLNFYNFVIIGYNSELYKLSYNDALLLKNVAYTPQYIRSNRPLLCLITNANVLTYLINRLHHSTKVNKFFKIPFKNAWFEKYYKYKFENENPLCFLFFSRNLALLKYGFLKFLKEKHPGSKFVCFFQDLVSTHEDASINEIKDIFDLVITFDNKEAEEYGFEHFPLVTSRYSQDLSSDLQESDVYFLGVAKNRLKDIITSYEKLRDKNLKCDFHIVGVEKKNQIHPNQINYIDSMSYLDNLRHINKTRCMLELMQKNGHGYTQRMMEAIVYDKKIITNNPTIKIAPFYNPDNIHHIENVESITDNATFYENFSRQADHSYKEEISPIRLLEFISKKLNTSKENES